MTWLENKFEHIMARKVGEVEIKDQEIRLNKFKCIWLV